MLKSGTCSPQQEKLLRKLEATAAGQVAAAFSDGRIAALEGAFPEANRRAVSLEERARSFLKTWNGLFDIPDVVLASANATKATHDRRREVVFHDEVSASGWLDGGVTVSFDGKGQLRSVRSNVKACPDVKLPTNDATERALKTVHEMRGILKGEKQSGAARTVTVEPGWLNRSGEPHAAFAVTTIGEDGPAILLVGSTPGDKDQGPVVIGTRPEGIPSLTPIPAYHINPATQCPDFVAFDSPGCLLPESITGNPEKVAWGFFKRYPSLFGTGDPKRQLKLLEVMTDAVHPRLGTTVVFQQLFAGVPVFGCQLRVHLSASLAIVSLSGSYYRDPGVGAVPAVAAAQCLETAYSAWASGGRPDLKFKMPSAASAELTIYPARLTRNGGNRNHLAWQFDFLDQSIFVSAETGKFVARINRFRDVINILDSNQRRAEFMQNNGKTVGLDECSWGATLQLVNGVLQVPAADLDVDATALSAALDEANAFWRRCGRNGWDNGGGDISGYVDAVFVGLNAQARPIGAVVCSRGMVTQDVIGHELTHHLINSTSNLCYVDESGAANESYADVFGNIMFEETDPEWPVGEGSAIGIIRNMRNPGKLGQPETYAAYSNPGPDSDEGGVHTNSGILNRAAVLLSDGEAGTTHRGIGRSRMARLYFETLTKRLTPWSQFVDVLHNTVAAARFLSDETSDGVDFPPLQPGSSNPFTGREEAEVLWAFDKVGLSARWTRGWFKVAGTGSMTQTFYASPLPAGESVVDVSVMARRQDSQRTSNLVRATGPMTDVNADSGITLAMTVSPVIGTTNARTEATLTSPNFIEMYLLAAIDKTVPPPAVGVPPLPALNQRPTPMVHHYPVVGGFYKYEDTFFSGDMLPASCVIEDVELELWRRDPTNANNFEPRPGPRHRLGEPPLVAEAFGAAITESNVGTQNLTVKVSCWHGVFVSCRYRLIYWIRGNGCGLPDFKIETTGIFGLP